jgi:hypothetical protein
MLLVVLYVFIPDQKIGSCGQFFPVGKLMPSAYSVVSAWPLLRNWPRGGHFLLTALGPWAESWRRPWSLGGCSWFAPPPPPGSNVINRDLKPTVWTTRSLRLTGGCSVLGTQMIFWLCICFLYHLLSHSGSPISVPNCQCLKKHIKYVIQLHIFVCIYSIYTWIFQVLKTRIKFKVIFVPQKIMFYNNDHLCRNYF